ncbi:MAG: cytochrome c [Gammaproteobacteria bacterium]|nr:cytochrome c [Gammaproteobacteria bacterium]NIR98493.1 cytochrome c [Gammaproteobacteria bacterium]NIT64237.1 cytochrome c [Gammaproteobacteria bacterium]NIV21181.1 c-type cytochrome [Gammaproteobacteria bacterium]NIX10102.1 c-type cytochrome [Gammaproteobacteria bacterium]
MNPGPPRRHRRGGCARTGGPILAVLLLGTALPTWSADTIAGRETYASYCANCHGLDGRGALPGVPNFARGEALLRGDLELFRLIESGSGAMPAFRGILSEQRILDVIAYLRTFQQ